MVLERLRLGRRPSALDACACCSCANPDRRSAGVLEENRRWRTQTFGRQTHDHGRSVPDLALDVERSAMEFGEFAGQWQTKPGAAVTAGQYGFHLLERPDDPGDVLGRDAD